MQVFKPIFALTVFGLCAVLMWPLLFASTAKAEVFYCQSTKTPKGNGKFCNFLLFDTSFQQHRQLVVAQGRWTRFAVRGRYDVFCVLVQDHRRVPDNIAYRTQQCRKTDTGRNYKFEIKELNMRRGRDGFSTDNVGAFLPANNQSGGY